MADISRFSFHYDPAEDRLALDTEDVAGGTTRLWLTQRLCRGLVVALTPLLQKAVAETLPPGQRATLQAWEQAAALEGFGGAPPVLPDTGAASGLVRAVHISPGDGRMTLTFDFGDSLSRTIRMTLVALRQGLAEMHRLQVIAGWPRDFWPDWIVDPVAHAGGGAVN